MVFPKIIERFYYHTYLNKFHDNYKHVIFYMQELDANNYYTHRNLTKSRK